MAAGRVLAMAQPRDQGTATIGRIEDWLRQHEREAIVGLVALAAALRVVLIADAAEEFYRGTPDRIQAYNIAGTTITFGVNGRF